ncbi:hypothetical protein VTN31DRAFT_5679 [Thermomyces dupontii]|uniref:uncharacterized protein n=1 Tax=Talaromyces thermophilus TaxID=28565 RepID=UPI0037432C2E
MDYPVVRTARSPNLDTMPFDIVYEILSWLDYLDYINLGRVSRTLYSLLQNDLLAKRVIEAYFLHTREAQLAAKGCLSFRDALGWLVDVREAVALANPYSVAIVAHAATFLYQGGVLCYVSANEIRVWNVHHAEPMEQVLNVRKALRRIVPGFARAEDLGAQIELGLLYYSMGMVAMVVEMQGEQPSLIVLDVTPRGHRRRKGGRVRFARQLTSTRRLFVRHNESYIFYGVYSRVGTDGDPQWTIEWADLRAGYRGPPAKPIILRNFPGSDIGQSVCFELFKDRLYAVTNRMDSNEDELHWVSYYEWTCIEPDPNVRRPRIHRVWRRNHKEGPIMETWTDMFLREDEKTGEIQIYECRREWLHEASDSTRTCYITPLKESQSVTVGGSDESLSSTFGSISFESPGSNGSDDSRVPEQSERRQPHGEREDPLSDLGIGLQRLDKFVHSDYNPGATCPRYDFILARTRFRTYNASASTFMDLVDDSPVPASSSSPSGRLRVRICSRKQLGSSVATSKSSTASGFSSDNRYVSRGTRLWPPDDAPPEIFKLVSPGGSTSVVQAAADERSLVYSVDVGRHQVLVLVSFDPKIKLKSMRPLKNSSTSSSSSSPPSENAPRTPTACPANDCPKVIKVGDRWATPLESARIEASQLQPTIRTEPAMHLILDQGIWLR